MKELLNKIREYEISNNICVKVDIMSDGSGVIREFWDDDKMEDFRTIEELHNILINSTYKKSELGHCIKPLEKIK